MEALESSNLASKATHVELLEKKLAEKAALAEQQAQEIQTLKQRLSLLTSSSLSSDQ